MRRALIASLVLHACALALLPWSSESRAQASFVRFASAAIEQPTAIEPEVAEPILESSERIPVESHDLPAPAPECETLPDLPDLPGLPRRPAIPRPYRLPRPLKLRQPPAPVAPSKPAAREESSTPPRLVKGSQVPPRYPPLARRRAWQGTVVLELSISATGVVETVALQKSSGFALLDREAMRVARQWRYEPGTKNGRAAGARLLQPVEFRLR